MSNAGTTRMEHYRLALACFQCESALLCVGPLVLLCGSLMGSHWAKHQGPIPGHQGVCG